MVSTTSVLVIGCYAAGTPNTPANTTILLATQNLPLYRSEYKQGYQTEQNVVQKASIADPA